MPQPRAAVAAAGRGRPRRHLALVAAALVAAACASGHRPTPIVSPRAGGANLVLRIRLAARDGGRIVTLPIEQYVAGCVNAELGSQRLDARAAGVVHEVQAALCRTYAVANLGRHAGEGFDLCSSVHCQVYRAPEGGARSAAAAASSTSAGEVIVYDGRPIQAVFHASCGGRTSAADAVWGGRSSPYLRSVEDRSCESSPPWTFVADADHLADALARAGHVARSGALLRIDVAERDVAGRALRLALVTRGATRVLRGEEFRAAVADAFGPLSLRSTRFEVQREGRRFLFRGRGFGHGVGLCQAGAIARARAGRSVEAILEHYFPGTRLARLTAQMVAGGPGAAGEGGRAAADEPVPLLWRPPVVR